MREASLGFSTSLIIIPFLTISSLFISLWMGNYIFKFKNEFKFKFKNI